MQIHRVQKAICYNIFFNIKKNMQNDKWKLTIIGAGEDGGRGDVPEGLRGVGGTPSPPSLPPHKPGSDDVPACTPWSLTDLMAYHPQSIN